MFEEECRSSYTNNHDGLWIIAERVPLSVNFNWFGSTFFFLLFTVSVKYILLYITSLCCLTGFSFYLTTIEAHWNRLFFFSVGHYFKFDYLQWVLFVWWHWLYYEIGWITSETGRKIISIRCFFLKKCRHFLDHRKFWFSDCTCTHFYWTFRFPFFFARDFPSWLIDSNVLAAHVTSRWMLVYQLHMVIYPCIVGQQLNCDVFIFGCRLFCNRCGRWSELISIFAVFFYVCVSLDFKSSFFSFDINKKIENALVHSTLASYSIVCLEQLFSFFCSLFYCYERLHLKSSPITTYAIYLYHSKLAICRGRSSSCPLSNDYSNERCVMAKKTEPSLK